jgi:L-alanine-DL-glutamate epimerase-like enolase superfamily enzyme
VFVIQDELGPFLLGRDPLAVEALHDQMLRLNRHGRSGLFITGLSAVDCALWDLRGKALGLPVYRLLGGPTRPAVPAYASMLSYSTEPEQAAAAAADFQAQGFRAQKWFFRYGPAEGAAGMQKNLAMAGAVRQAVGPHYPLMFDAFMGWDFPYALEMMRSLAPLNPAWVEEPLPPERVESLRQLHTLSGVPLATGEHVYTRWQVKTLLAAGAIDYIQTDPDWTGGISEQVKICALASAFDIPVVAHGHSLLPALHIAAAQSAAVVPYVEFLIVHQEGKQFFHKPVYRPVNGMIQLPELPGLGLALDPAKVKEKHILCQMQ